MEFIAKILGNIMNVIFLLLDKVGVHSMGLGIILFTVLIYLLLLPLTAKQQKFTRMQAKLAPELQIIQEKYQGQNQNPDAMSRMNEETKALYKKYGVSPAGGCLPMLLQMPVLLALYRVIADIPAYVPLLSNVAENSDWYYFFGMNISQSPMTLVKEGVANGSVWLVIGAVLIPVLSAASQWFSSWMTTKMNKTVSDHSSQNGSAGNMAKGMNLMMPLMSAFFCVTLPVGMGIYWITGAVVRCVQQFIINWWLDRHDNNKYEIIN